MFSATAMSSGEGAEEAAKDAADIATFFKSGKRGLWDIVRALAPVGWVGKRGRPAHLQSSLYHIMH